MATAGIEWRNIATRLLDLKSRSPALTVASDHDDSYWVYLYHSFAPAPCPQTRQYRRRRKHRKHRKYAWIVTKLRSNPTHLPRLPPTRTIPLHPNKPRSNPPHQARSSRESPSSSATVAAGELSPCATKTQGQGALTPGHLGPSGSRLSCSSPFPCPSCGASPFNRSRRPRRAAGSESGCTLTTASSWSGTARYACAPANLPLRFFNLDCLGVADQQTEGGFPELKILKQRIRNLLQPDLSLGHSDKPSTRDTEGQGTATSHTLPAAA